MVGLGGLGSSIKHMLGAVCNPGGDNHGNTDTPVGAVFDLPLMRSISWGKQAPYVSYRDFPGKREDGLSPWDDTQGLPGRCLNTAALRCNT